MTGCWVIATFLLVSVKYGVTKLRLVPGPDKGRLEVFHAGSWGTVCDDGFDSRDAVVACRELGFNRQHSLFWTAKGGTGETWLDNLRCSGNETTLSACEHNKWGDDNCGHHEDIGIFCTEGIKIRPQVSILKMLTDEKVKLRCLKVDGFKDNVTTSFKWSKGGRAVSTSDSYYVSGSRDETGNITCSLSDSSGYAISTMSVLIDIQISPPGWMEEIKNVIEGRVANICLPISSNPLPYKYEWRKTGLKSTWETTDNCPVLDTVARSDAGEYFLKIYNNMTNSGGRQRTGRGSQHVKLNVLYAPTVTCPSEIRVDIEYTVVLNCSVDASPFAHNITWSLSSIVLTSSQDPHHTIAHVQLSDSGVYVCEATNTMTDYSGESVTGKGDCRTLLVVNAEPIMEESVSSLSTLWPSYKFYIIGGSGAVFIMAVGVVLAVLIARKSSSRKQTITSKQTSSSDGEKEMPCTDTMTSPHNPEYYYSTDAYGTDTEAWATEGAYGNISPGDCQGGGNSYLTALHNAQYAGNDYTEDPTNCGQHYGNVCFDSDVYQNVTVGQSADNCYQNTVF